jgi:hypothetical protein
MITHHPNCRADYPEKVSSEQPQQIAREVDEDGYWVDTCVDCGAFQSNLPDADDPYWDEAKREIEIMLQKTYHRKRPRN